MSAVNYDALMVVSFGGPEGPDDVMPFLRNVTRGRGVPEDRLLAVAEHYHHFGGKSPINDQNRALMAALKPELAKGGIVLPMFWGNRFWNPMLPETLADMRDAGIKHALAFVTSAYGSYSGCRAYREDIAKAQAAVGEGAPVIDTVRKFWNHPGFVETMVDRVNESLAVFDGDTDDVRMIYTAHSVPMGMARTSPYEAQLRETCRLVGEAVGKPEWDLVWQSRSGPPEVPWLEPDILDHMRAIHKEGVRSVIVTPIGFTSDHMEVVYDLDYEAKHLAEELGMAFVRTKTAGTHPRFVTMVRELFEERLRVSTNRVHLGVMQPSPDICAPDCCPAPQRPPTR